MRKSLKGLALILAALPLAGCSTSSKADAKAIKSNQTIQEVTLSFNGRDFYKMTPETCFSFYAFMDRVSDIRKTSGSSITQEDYRACLEAPLLH